MRANDSMPIQPVAHTVLRFTPAMCTDGNSHRAACMHGSDLPANGCARSESQESTLPDDGPNRAEARGCAPRRAPAASPKS